MKKIILILLMTCGSLYGYSQGQNAMQFDGITLDCTVSELINQLISKNYKLTIESDKYIGMEGNYNGYTNIPIIIEKTKDNKINSIGCDLYHSDDIQLVNECYKKEKTKLEQQYKLKDGIIKENHTYYYLPYGTIRLSIINNTICFEVSNNPTQSEQKGENTKIQNIAMFNYPEDENPHIKMDFTFLDCTIEDLVMRFQSKGYKLQNTDYEKSAILTNGTMFGYQNVNVVINPNNRKNVSSVVVFLYENEDIFKLTNEFQKIEKLIKDTYSIYTIKDERPKEYSVYYEVDGGDILMSIKDGKISLLFVDKMFDLGM